MDEHDRWKRKPLSSELVARAVEFGILTANAMRGIEGYGRSGILHTTRILSMCDSLPVLVTLVDTDEARLRAFVASVAPLLEGKLVLMDAALSVVADSALPAGLGRKEP
ncbi:DUF190 domain-containing protein [Streptomyces sp. NPDC048258]|uniref:DUF190 domain-containing protein n=1 Tax=Streptomyces sp. NPDC048258 TaxID=3365527 RepID=UPI00371EC1ED